MKTDSSGETTLGGWGSKATLYSINQWELQYIYIYIYDDDDDDDDIWFEMV
jgi:hypothetical protein